MARDPESYLEIARTTGVFKPCELDVIKELAEDNAKNPASTYVILREEEKDGVEGFIIFGRTPMTEFTWDIYWIVVRADRQGKGVGKKLLAKMEGYALSSGPRANIRIETSTKSEYLATRGFYGRTGFREAGVLEDFYSKGDSLMTFYKEIRK
jgi:ribosomal protein S18 acetylase RimI-like enzyme